jgi:carbohydrate-selective porin OprB
MDTASGRRFSAVGEGLTWITEADFQHRLGELPGGVNLGTIYAFDADFRELDGNLQLPPSDADLPEESTSWAAYWTGWQYLHTEGPVPEVLNGSDASPDLRGFGVFARLGVADKTTNPVAWAASLGFGGRGVLSRELDTWGLGAFHNALQVPETAELPSLGENAMGVEAFYAFALSRAARLSFDVQWLDSAFDTVEDSVVLGLRLNLSF